MNLKTFAAMVVEKLGLATPPQRHPTRVALRSDTPSQSTNATTATVSAAITAAEAGDTRLLFGLYRDIVVTGSHAQTEFGKRKAAVLGAPCSLQAVDKDNPDDVRAAEACRWMIDHCTNWTDARTHLLDSALWPVAVGQKVFRPTTAEDDFPEGLPLRFVLEKIEPVNAALLCFKQPYMRQVEKLKSEALKSPASSSLQPFNPSTPQPWEPDLRFYSTDADGRIDWTFEKTYGADPDEHIIHRGHALVGIRDNWGGPMRAVAYWWLLSVLGRDWFGRGMENYGTPFMVGRTDVSDAQKVTLLQEAFALSTKIRGIVIGEDTEIELKEIAISNLADAYERFLGVCNREQSKVIVGQTQSTEAQATGLGSGVAKLHGEVREDLCRFDQMKLGETLRAQLFKQFLTINAIPGRAPNVIWGGEDPAQSKATSALLVDLSNAGLEPTDEALPALGERIGFELQRKALPPERGLPGRFGEQTPSGDMRALSAPSPRLTSSDPTDEIASRKAAALAKEFRGRYAPLRAIILESKSADEALEKMNRYIPDLKVGEAGRLLNEALELCAVAGAGAGKSETVNSKP